MARHWWHDRSKSYRVPILARNVTSAADYITVVPQTEWDDFWSAIDANGYGVSFFGPGGEEASYFRYQFIYSAAFQVQWNRSAAVGDCEVVWFYYDDSAPVDESTAITTTTQQNTSGPVLARIAPDLIAEAESPGATTPNQRVVKTSTEDILIWWDITDLLGRADGTLNGREAGAYYLDSVLFGAGYSDAYSAGSAAGLVDANYCSMVETQDGRLYFGMYLSGGAAATDYELRLSLKLRLIGDTATAIITDSRALLSVQDVEEA